MFDLIVFIIMGFLISIPIGPTTILTFQRVLRFGLKAGIATSLGLVVADLVDSIIIISRVPIIDMLINQYGNLLKITGFVIILVIAVTTYKSEINLNKTNQITRSNLIKFFGGIFIYALIHPASLFLFLSFNASGLINESNKFIFPLGLILGELLWWIPLNFVFIKFSDRVSTKYLSLINKVTCILIVILSAFVLLK